MLVDANGSPTFLAALEVTLEVRTEMLLLTVVTSLATWWYWTYIALPPKPHCPSGLKGFAFAVTAGMLAAVLLSPPDSKAAIFAGFGSMFIVRKWMHAEVTG